MCFAGTQGPAGTEHRLPKFPKNCSWSNMEQRGGNKEEESPRAAPKSSEPGEWPLDLGVWRRQHRQHPHLDTAWRGSERPPGILWDAGHPENCDPTVFPVRLMVPNGASLPPTLPCRSGTLCPDISSSPIPSLAANSHMRCGSQITPLCPQIFVPNLGAQSYFFSLSPGTLLG